MDIRASSVGPKIFYKLPSIREFATADITAVDSAVDNSALYPYALSATVNQDLATGRFCFDEAGATLGAGQMMAVGTFLTPDNDLTSLLFQLSGKALIRTTTTVPGTVVPMGFFYGRTESDTIVSSVAAAENLTIEHMSLPSRDLIFTDSIASINSHSIVDELVSLVEASGNVHVFGFYIKNTHGATAVTLRGSIDLAFRKHKTILPVHDSART